jgi:catechol 2,3-dioxygenase-like lactoylglutathione lyase family enzyme
MSASETSRRPIHFENSIPILRVRDLAVSLDYYVNVLGFKVDWQTAGMASVSRDRGALMLCEGEQGHPGTWVWFGVGDAAALYDELEITGATIPLPPTNYSWAREIHVQDPDGHVLRFGSEPLEDAPFSPWVAWYRSASGA